jgi:hypothetical protein
MKKLLLATTALLALSALQAKADLVLRGGTPTTAFIDVKGMGFGAVHRLLTLQTNDLERGAVLPGIILEDNAIGGADKADAPTFSQLGWTSPDAVGLFFDADQEGGHGITLNRLAVTIFDGITPLATFATASPIDFSAADLALEPGNGEGGFFFSLTDQQKAQFITLLAMPGSGDFIVSTRASLGCVDGEVCMQANDGPDSFNAVNLLAPTVPEASTWAMMILGFLGVGLFGMRRRVGSRPIRMISA